MTKKPKLAKPDAPKPRTWKDEVRAQNESVERLCVELGIDQAERRFAPVRPASGGSNKGQPQDFREAKHQS
jgi:hypothetical protein